MPRQPTKPRKQTPQGKRFEQLCKSLNITPSYLYEALGVNNMQSISHWKYRGVPREYAIPVAAILHCHPTDISTIKLEQDLKQRSATNEKTISDLVTLIVDRAEELDPEKRAQLYRTIASFFS